MTKKEENREDKEERRKIEEENEKIVSLLNELRYEVNGFELCKLVDMLLKCYVFKWGMMEQHEDRTITLFTAMNELKKFLLEIEEHYPNRHNF